jgi:hypothetical protein
VSFSKCFFCDKRAVWVEGRLTYPPIRTAPLPHEDLPEPALETYEEARGITDTSPRAGAALLRLCLEQLVEVLGTNGRDLNVSVGELVSLGMPVQIQQAMDTVRFIGNEAVHPGTIDVRDDPDMVRSLFELVNAVAESMITQPRKIGEMYSRFPETKLSQIERRDKGQNP